MLVVSNSFLLPSLLPKEVIEEIDSEKIKEKTLLAVATLVSNLITGAAQAWKEGEIKKLDPNPGDSGCQMRGYLLYLFSSDISLREETAVLGARFEKRENVDFSNRVFFKELYGKAILSKKMEFLLQCYLLAVTREPIETLNNGIVLTKSNVKRLLLLSSDISVVPYKWRQKIVEIAQSNLSANSVALLRREAEKLTSFASKDKEQILYMLSPEMTHIYTPDEKEYEPKTFGCLFYEYKTILFRLREAQSLVCFKSIVPSSGTPFWILLQPRKTGAEFSIIPDEAYSSFSSKSSMVIFEGVVNAKYDKKGFSEKITAIGFTNLILVSAAIEDPYERTSDLTSIKNEEAREEIKRYRQFAEKIECQKKAEDPLLILDHVYCNLLKAEIGGKV